VHDDPPKEKIKCAAQELENVDNGKTVSHLESCGKIQSRIPLPESKKTKLQDPVNNIPPKKII